MARVTRIYILIIKVNKLFSFFSSRCFLKEIENMYSVFLSSYTNTRESLGELEKAVETLACSSCSHSISRSPKLPLVFVKLDRNTVHVFYFLNINLCEASTSDNLTICYRKKVKLKSVLTKFMIHKKVIRQLLWFWFYYGSRLAEWSNW